MNIRNDYGIKKGYCEQVLFRRKTSFSSAIFLLLAAITFLSIPIDAYERWPEPGDGNLKIVHPGYDLDTLHPKAFEPWVTGMGFLSDGRLVISCYPDANALGMGDAQKGDVYILDNFEAGIPEEVEVNHYATGLAGPLGLAVVDDVIYVRDRRNLHRLEDTGDSLAKVVGIEEPYEAGGHPGVFGALHRDGKMYTILGNTGHIGHGLLETDLKTGERSITSGGFRNPDGIAFGPEGEIFVTDNQGDWLPANRLLHVTKDRWYGYGGSAPSGKERTPVTVQLPQGEAGLSPTGLLFIKEGVYSGQMFLADMRLSNITRVFLEKVNGEYQGTAFLFSGGFESGPHRLIYGPDGHLYVGCIGSPFVPTWNWRNRFTGLQRLRKNSTNVFEMIAVRSLADGFEIEFNEEVAAYANDTSKYTVLSWRYEPTKDYGGPKIDLKKMKINSINISSDKKRVNLQIDSLEVGRVINIKLNDYKSLAGNSVWTAETWYTLNNFGPADEVGCLDRTYNEYSASAKYDDGLQCRTVGIGDAPVSELRTSWFQISGRKIQIKKSGKHQITVYNLSGNPVMTQSGSGKVDYQMKSDLSPGLYVVEMRSDGKYFKHRFLLM
ncbi:MAG: T9SS type A sorting domain-containing protein [Fibrobacteria bacterium]|nr:T9SS type A sorting domain-containing protein [Fibrobacteria bacterium]